MLLTFLQASLMKKHTHSFITTGMQSDTMRTSTLPPLKAASMSMTWPPSRNFSSIMDMWKVSSLTRTLFLVSSSMTHAGMIPRSLWKRSLKLPKHALGTLSRAAPTWFLDMVQCQTWKLLRRATCGRAPRLGSTWNTCSTISGRRTLTLNEYSRMSRVIFKDWLLPQYRRRWSRSTGVHLAKKCTLGQTCVKRRPIFYKRHFSGWVDVNTSSPPSIWPHPRGGLSFLRASSGMQMIPISVGCTDRYFLETYNTTQADWGFVRKQPFQWICQVAADNGLDGILTMIATPSLFFNECEVHFQFNWKSLAELPGDVIVQVEMSVTMEHWNIPICNLHLLKDRNVSMHHGGRWFSL